MHGNMIVLSTTTEQISITQLNSDRKTVMKQNLYQEKGKNRVLWKNTSCVHRLLQVQQIENTSDSIRH